jgi:hypothetical protein
MTTSTRRFWDDFYRDGPVWSGRPNALLVREVTGLPPGVIGHAGPPPWQHDHPAHAEPPTTAEVRAALDLDPREWRGELEEVVDRAVTDPHGQPATRQDNVLRLRRRP